MQTIKIGGRTFVELGESTIEHDLFVLDLTRKAGLDEVVLEDGESPDRFARRLLNGLATNMAALELLGAFMVPEGTKAEDWSPELAAETARHFGGRGRPITGEDKAAVFELLKDLTIHFFAKGVTSVWSSRTSSGTEGHAVAESEHPVATETGTD